MIEPVYSPAPGRYDVMDYRRCGRSGVKIPALTLGMWHNFGSCKPMQDIKAMAHYAFDNGIPADSRMARGTTLKEEVLTPTMLSSLHELADMAAQRGQSLAQMALAWLLDDARVTSVIIGASSVGQIEDNLKALAGTGFSADERRRIEEISAPVQLKA